MWIILSFFTALFYGLQGAWSKNITKTVDHFTVTWAMFSFALPVVGVSLIYTGIPEIKSSFFWGLGGSLIINLFAFTFFIKAIKISPLSLTYPFLAFTPVFLIFTGNLFLGEIPSKTGIWGVILITSGAYLLNLKKSKTGILEPVKAIIREKGSLLMLIVAFLWGFAAAFDKVALLSSSPYFYITIFNLCFAVIYLPFLYKKNPGLKISIKKNYFKFIILGILGGLMVICQMSALETALVSYVISIKRSGMIITMIMGFMFFNEEIHYGRILGTLLMCAGVFLISVFGQ
ncbi:MAG: DMT family transporter [Elusimicrobiota bacterium]